MYPKLHMPNTTPPVAATSGLQGPSLKHQLSHASNTADALKLANITLSVLAAPLGNTDMPPVATGRPFCPRDRFVLLNATAFNVCFRLM